MKENIQLAGFKGRLPGSKKCFETIVWSGLAFVILLATSHVMRGGETDIPRSSPKSIKHHFAFNPI